MLYESLKQGCIVTVTERETISDSTAGGLEPDSLIFAHCRDLLDEALLVSEADIKHAMRLLAQHERWLVEGAAAVASLVYVRFTPSRRPLRGPTSGRRTVRSQYRVGALARVFADRH